MAKYSAPAKALKLLVKWSNRTHIMKPGTYRIPSEISSVLAKCAVADKAGEIVEIEPFREPAKPKTKPAAAPENKGLDGAPENKAPVE